MEQVPHHVSDSCKDWEAKADTVLQECEAALYPPVADIQAQMWHQLMQHATVPEALDFMHQYFPLFVEPKT